MCPFPSTPDPYTKMNEVIYTLPSIQDPYVIIKSDRIPSTNQIGLFEITKYLPVKKDCEDTLFVLCINGDVIVKRRSAENN